MPEKFVVRHHNDFPTWLIIHSSLDKVEPTGDWEVCLTINGVEVPVRETLLHIEKCLDDLVEGKAREILKEKLAEIDSISFQFREFLREKFNLQADD